jgi:dihydrodipicolinate synthase/N-acetylneuraminate lyase
MTANAKWTPEEDNLLEQMAKARIRPEEMAKVFKCRTVVGIKTRLDKMNLTSHYHAEVDMEEFKRLMKGAK